MALNKYMHPRNPYKTRKPDFKELAIKYPEFREKVTQNLSGKVILDFKDPEALRALTVALLRDDFNLIVSLSVDRLIPTVPQRLNYILWLEDIFEQSKNLKGIDIGAGASCIYPLLGCKQNGWSFLASEVDDQNLVFAKKNIQQNNMGDKITVKKVKEETVLIGLVEDDTTYDFCMCNPPFYTDHLEAQGITSSRSDNRPEPHSVSTASEIESISWGGEVKFVTKMIEESLILKNKIRVYTSLLGKKMNLSLLKDELQRKKIPRFSSTEFCQGRTMRWGLAWTFDDTVKFPKSTFKSLKNMKPPISYTVPRDNPAVSDYTVQAFTTYLKDAFDDLKIKYNIIHSGKFYTAMNLQAKENTWSHQRRKRRQKHREETQETEICGANSSESDCKSSKEGELPKIQTDEKTTEGDVLSDKDENIGVFKSINGNTCENNGSDKGDNVGVSRNEIIGVNGGEVIGVNKSENLVENKIGKKENITIHVGDGDTAEHRVIEVDSAVKCEADETGATTILDSNRNNNVKVGKVSLANDKNSASKLDAELSDRFTYKRKCESTGESHTGSKKQKTKDIASQESVGTNVGETELKACDDMEEESENGEKDENFKMTNSKVRIEPGQVSDPEIKTVEINKHLEKIIDGSGRDTSLHVIPQVLTAEELNCDESNKNALLTMKKGNVKEDMALEGPNLSGTNVLDEESSLKTEVENLEDTILPSKQTKACDIELTMIPLFSSGELSSAANQQTHLRKDVLEEFKREKEKNLEIALSNKDQTKKTKYHNFDENEECLILFKMVLRKEEGIITLTMEHKQGNKEAMHQIMQYFKNKFHSF